MNISIQKFLEENGPSLSRDVIKDLVLNGVNAVAARQRISRAVKGGQISKLSMKFEHNYQFLFNDSDFGTKQFYAALLKSLEETGSVYGVAIQSLLLHELIPQYIFQSFTGSPDEELGRHIINKKMLEHLKFADLIQSTEIPNLGLCLSLSSNTIPDKLIRSVRGKLKAEQVLIEGFKEWVKKLGLVSYESVRIRGENPLFGCFRWDLTAPSYINPLPKFTKGKQPIPGFIVADFVGKSIASKDQIEFFIRKVQAVRSVKNFPSFIAFLVANAFSSDAFNFGRKHGIVITTPKILFGSDIAEGLKKLISLYTVQEIDFKKDPDFTKNMFTHFIQHNGFISNLRGKMFEYMVGETLSGRYSSISIGETIRDPETNEFKTDIDVLAKSNNETEVLVVECKGLLGENEVLLSDIENWLDKRIPSSIKWLNKSGRFPKLKKKKFEFWTTGILTDEAIEYLNKENKGRYKGQIAWKDRDSVKIEMKQHASVGSVKVIDQFYKAQ